MKSNLVGARLKLLTVKDFNASVVVVDVVLNASKKLDTFSVTKFFFLSAVS